MGDASKPEDGEKQLPVVIRNREFTQPDIDAITGCVREYFEFGRTRISVEVCKALNWRQPNGWLKERACREVLLRLETLGYLSLPPSAWAPERIRLPSASRVTRYTSEYDLCTPITTIEELPIFQLAKGTHFEKAWNSIVDEYHYLGHRIAVGRCLKYLVTVGNRVVGAISFSSPAWRLSPRDTLLQKLGLSPAEIREQVINNSRFLILPSVNVENLASRILAQSTRLVRRDWHTYYSVTPLAAETFVDTTRYAGTCYRAANWLEIGLTRGTAKRGSSPHRTVVPPKAVFLYGLDRHLRRHLWEIHHATQTCMLIPQVGGWRQGQ